MKRVSFLPFLVFMFLPVVIVEKYMPTSIIATTTVVLSVYFSILIMALTYKINVKFFIENLINVITYFVVIFGLIFISDTFKPISNFSAFLISMTLITILLWLLGRRILEKFNIPTSDAYKYVVKNKEISILTFFYVFRFIYYSIAIFMEYGYDRNRRYFTTCFTYGIYWCNNINIMDIKQINFTKI